MVHERFIILLTKEVLNEITVLEKEELKLLMQENPEFLDKKAIIKNYWKSKRISSAVNTAMYKKVIQKIRAEEALSIKESFYNEPEIAVSRGVSLKLWLSAAAIIIVILGACLWYYNGNYEQASNVVIIKWHQKITKPKTKSVITLSDNTIVYLNSSSTLKFPEIFNGKTREVYLDGEAYFDVHKDHAHPFVIHTHKMNVRVLGTAFNIKSYQSDPLSETTLIRGSIEVTLNDRPSDRIILKPKEKLIVKNNPFLKKQTNLKSDLSSEDNVAKGTSYALTTLTYFPNYEKTIVETSWMQNKLVFSDKEFTELSVQLERWYGIKIIFDNDRVKHHRFSGLFEKETASEALDALKIIAHFNYKIIDSTVYIH